MKTLPSVIITTQEKSLTKSTPPLNSSYDKITGSLVSKNSTSLRKLDKFTSLVEKYVTKEGHYIYVARDNIQALDNFWAADRAKELLKPKLATNNTDKNVQENPNTPQKRTRDSLDCPNTPQKKRKEDEQPLLTIENVNKNDIEDPKTPPPKIRTEIYNRSLPEAPQKKRTKEKMEVPPLSGMKFLGTFYRNDGDRVSFGDMDEDKLSSSILITNTP